MKGNFESVKLRKELLAEVRKHIEDTGQTISGFISVVVKKAIKKSKKDINVS